MLELLWQTSVLRKGSGQEDIDIRRYRIFRGALLKSIQIAPSNLDKRLTLLKLRFRKTVSR